MATKNVLQYVQSCLNTMDSDEVDTIADTAEATQIAELLEDVYYELLNRQEWEFLKGPVTLTAAGDITNPTKFTVPAGLRHLHKVWYNIDESGGMNRRELLFVEPEDFLLRTGGSAAAGKLLITEGSQLQFYVRTDRMPTFYTTFDDVTIYCDAYKASIETSLVTSKISAFGVALPAFAVDDEFVPELPENMVPLLQATLNATSHLYFKQQASAPDEARVRRQLAQARTRNSIVASRSTYYANSFGR